MNYSSNSRTKFGSFIVFTSNIIGFAYRNIFRFRARTLFTLIGIAGSIALLTSLSTINKDLKNQLDSTITNTNIDIVIQERGSSTPVSSRIPDDIVKDLAVLENVKSISPLIVGSIRTNGIPYLYLFGFPSIEVNSSVNNWFEKTIIEGRHFNKGKNEIILGRITAKRIKKNVGDKIILGSSKEYVVTGIYWVGQGILDSGAIIDISSSQTLLKREGYINLLVVEVFDKIGTAELINSISDSFPILNPIPAKALSGRIRAISMIDSFITAISVLALFLCSLIILNTFLMAISERTREIGILLAIGWSRFMIICVILSEAVIIGSIGGILGYLLSFPTLFLLKFLPTVATGWVPNNPSFIQVFVSVGLSILISIISSIYPAVFATRLHPAKALRYE